MAVARDKIEDLEGKINIKMLCKTVGKVYNKKVKCYERKESTFFYLFTCFSLTSHADNSWKFYKDGRVNGLKIQ